MIRRFRTIFILPAFLSIIVLCGCAAGQSRTIGAETAASPVPQIRAAGADIKEEAPAATAQPVYSGAVPVFTEIASAGTDWAELYNSGAAPLQLADFYIGTSQEFSKACALPQKELLPGEYTVLYGKNADSPENRADFAISKAGDTLYLFHKDGQLLSSLAVPALNDNVSYVYLDGAWHYCFTPTPGARNTGTVTDTLTAEAYSAGTAPLIISEVLASNTRSAQDEYGAYSDFAELYNPGPAGVSLAGWFLSDGEDCLTKWAFPDITLPAGQYLVIYLSGRESTASQLHASFSLNGEETLYLFNSAEGKYTSLSMPEISLSDISAGPDGALYRIPTPGAQNGVPLANAESLGYFDAESVYISEVCSETEETDWIELYNGSDAAVDISGFMLSDSLTAEKKYTVGEAVLAPGEYYVIAADAHLTAQQGSAAPFGISSAGETLYLFDSTGRVTDAFACGVLDGAASSGRIEGNADIDRVFFRAATKGKKNSDSYYSGRAAEPAFSETALYHTDAFTLELTAEGGAQIYYTTDGSEPKQTAKQLYSGPVTIKKNTVVRALCTEPGKLSSKVVTCTYLFEDAHEIPVVCICMSPSDKDAVWSAKSKQSKTKVEREGYLSYYETDGRLGTQFPAGFKPKGAGTLGRSQASLSIHLRGMYGQSSVTYPFFSEYGWDTYASLVVRNSGQDYTKGRIRDSLASRICLGLNIDVAATHPVAVYINGEYYGLYDFNEDQNADYLHTHYGTDQSKVEIIRYNTTTVKGSNSNWKKVIEYAKTKNFKSDEVLAEFSQWVDTDYFIDYLVCSIYLCNTDMANQKYWHATDNSIRWRPLFYDFDYAMGFSNSAKRSIISNFFNSEGTKTATSTVYTHIACALVKNASWRQKFIERYVELTCTVFDPERVSGILDTLVAEMEPEMARHIARWGSRSAPASVKEWKENIESIRSWFKARPEYALESLKSYFKISSSELEELKEKYGG